MRVLWVSAVSPLPLTDGNRHRHFHLLREVAREHEVVLVCPADERERVALEAVSALGVDARSVPPLSRGRGRISAGFHREPACLVPPDIDALCTAVGGAGRFDMAFGALSVARAVMTANADRRLLDDQNVEEELYSRLWRAEPLGPRKLVRGLDALAVRGYERRSLRLPDAVTVSSARDLAQLQSRAPGQRFHLVPNGVDTRAIPFVSEGREPDTIMFAGAMSWPPNVAAAVSLARDIMPLIWKERADARLWIVGKDPAPEVAALAGERIAVTGTVDSMLPYLQRASAAVVPLRAGGGTRLKILEAMAAGLPVVTTSIGAEGLGLVDGREVVIADSPSPIADAVVRLMRDPRFAAGLVATARRRAEAEFEWTVIAPHLLELFATL